MKKSKYKEIFKLKRMLEESKIPFEWFDRSVSFKNTTPALEMFEHYQICYPRKKQGERWISVIEGDGSYGHEDDKLEIMGGFTRLEVYEEDPTVKGWLTANNVYKRIKTHWEENKNV